MKKTMLLSFLAVALLFCSCGKTDSESKNSASVSADTVSENEAAETAVTTVSENEAAETTVTTIAEPLIDSIDLVKDSLDMSLGDTQKVPFVIMPTDAPEVDIVWQTSNKNIAKVDSEGNIEAVGAGTCTITVEAGGRSDNLTINVSAADLYLSMGDYEGAYSVASDAEEKESIKGENIIAYVSKLVPDKLKNPSSFLLHDAWIKNTDITSKVVLKVSGMNGMGGKTVSYWLFTYSDDDKEYEIFNTVNDLDEEEFYSWDDADDKLEKLFNNLTRDMIKDINENDNQLPKSGVDRINKMFENDVLKDVELLPDNQNMLDNLEDSDDSEV